MTFSVKVPAGVGGARVRSPILLRSSSFGLVYRGKFYYYQLSEEREGSLDHVGDARQQALEKKSVPLRVLHIDSARTMC